MSTYLTAYDTGTSPTRRTARCLLIAVHVAIIAVPATITSFGVPGGPATGSPLIAYPLAAAILGLQLRHSLAFADGVPPRGAIWSFIALTALVYLPIRQFNWNWVALEACIMASGVMLLPGWLRLAAVIAPLIGMDVAAALTYGTAYATWYWTDSVFFIFVGLYASARLPRLLNDLQETRAELAELAVGQERLRISRDLHDLLGHSLSAVSLKGDLAIRLLRRNPKQALAEIESLTELARDAQRGIRAVSRNEHAVSLRSEAEAAAALLAAAGIDTRIDLNVAPLSLQVERMLAWVVREGVANALRHSRAHRCSITAGRRGGTVFLEIVNDGVLTGLGEGSGLIGIAERARALSGTSSCETADGQFRLNVQVPEAVA